jgi:hypothetical protein
MRKLATIAAAVAGVIALLAIYLAVTTPKRGVSLSFPLNAQQRAFLGRVPASAETFALIPAAATMQGKLSANPVTRELLQQWKASDRLPRAWMLGNADLLVWRRGKQTTLLLRLDGLRALLARASLLFSDVGDETSTTRVLLSPPDEEPIATADLDNLLASASALPPGDALVVQLEGTKGAYPPISRPAVSSIRITSADVFMTSRAPRSADAGATIVLHPRFARSSILTAAFATPSRAIEDMNRLVGAKASTLLEDGGAIVLYDVDTNKLLPRPREVIVIPATPDRRAALQDFLSRVTPDALRQLAGFHVETADTPTELLVAFERASIDRYQKDAFDAATLEANSWSLRLDPRKAIPMLQQVTGAPGLRYIAPRLFRSARDAGDWVEHLDAARFVEAGDTIEANAEVLRVRISE